MGWGSVCVPSPCSQPGSFLPHLLQISLAVQPKTVTSLASNKASPDESGGGGFWCESRQCICLVWSVSTLSAVFFLQVDVKVLLQVCFYMQGLDSVCMQQQDENLEKTTVFFICVLQA